MSADTFLQQKGCFLSVIFIKKPFPRRKPFCISTSLRTKSVNIFIYVNPRGAPFNEKEVNKKATRFPPQFTFFFCTSKSVRTHSSSYVRDHVRATWSRLLRTTVICGALRVPGIVFLNVFAWMRTIAFELLNAREWMRDCACECARAEQGLL